MTTRIDQADFTDEDLVRQLQAGATELAMTELERRYGKRIHHFVLGMIRDPHLANDVTQEVFEKLLLKNNLYRLGTNFRAWLFEVARNQALTMLRSSKRLPRPVSALQVPGQDAETILDNVPAPSDDEALVEAEFMTAFQQAVDDLPERYRTVFELCVRQGCAYQEAGSRLGIPTGTVAIRIMRARKRLFSALQHHLGRLRRPPACFQ